jgi:hypothetical protein
MQMTHTGAAVAAIPTVYNGIQFRSRMEAQCAFLFDRLGWEWEYEKESMMLSTGITYTPDFWVLDGDMIAECRGYNSERGDRQLREFASEPSRERDFLVMGPDACLIYRAGSSRAQTFRVTYCPRCDVWAIAVSGDCGVVCGRCIDLTFKARDLRVEAGKFTIDGLPLDSCDKVFDKAENILRWRLAFGVHILRQLNRRDILNDPLSPDGKTARDAVFALADLLRAEKTDDR